ncbi:hypothetical protein BDN70DRAFT_986367 [Pholiota conissans]|uniref:Carbohydrate-binding module family 19 domain-containing protein n=1 Tax=Pholiota conissans TaxID=109636 RepID=A0A9P5Z110_9AGAR|nr:hypothetical protein BDN70DRAFT_986367 [Pholiota conissans]
MQLLGYFVTLALTLSTSARSLQYVRVARRAGFDLANGQAAIALNDKFKTLTPDSPCTAPEDACVNDKFAQCVGGKFVLQSCGPGTGCAALPLVNSPGTSVTCTTSADLAARIAATGATDVGSSTGSSASPPPAATTAAAPPAQTSSTAGGSSADPQTSLTLDPAVIAKGFANDGQDVPAAGQVASLTSTNNFINFCLTVNQPLTNGAQVVDGSCNPAPMGSIPAKTKMPSSKFIFPKNGGTVAANTAFTIQMGIKNLETGNFVNAQENYFSAPQQLNAQGIIRGHSHVVIETINALDSTTVLDPTVFAFFKGLNAAAENGILTASVDKGLPTGFYKLSSINSAANHQPVLAAVAQHGSLDDTVYFTVA